MTMPAVDLPKQMQLWPWEDISSKEVALLPYQ